MFLERVQDGLGENKNLMRKLMGNDLGEIMKASGDNSNSGNLIDLASPLAESKVPEGDDIFVFSPDDP